MAIEYLKRIEKKIIQENYLIGLGFSDGYVFFRAVRREIFPLLYDLFAEISDFAGTGTVDMAALQYISPKELKSDTLSATNILEVKEETHIYQTFYGLSPSATRVFTAYPRETEINQLDVGLHLPTYAIFGFLDGFESPIDEPSPRSINFIPRGPKLAFAFYNPTNNKIKPLMRFVINRLKVEVIKDVDLIMKILERRREATLATIGGIDGWTPGAAQYQKWWGVQPIPLGAARDEVAAYLTAPAGE